MLSTWKKEMYNGDALPPADDSENNCNSSQEQGHNLKTFLSFKRSIGVSEISFK